VLSSAVSFLLGTFAVAFQDPFHFQNKIEHRFCSSSIELARQL
jgi:uncharacterized protein YbaP (TraB family)